MSKNSPRKKRLTYDWHMPVMRERKHNGYTMRRRSSHNYTHRYKTPRAIYVFVVFLSIYSGYFAAENEVEKHKHIWRLSFKMADSEMEDADWPGPVDQ